MHALWVTPVPLLHSFTPSPPLCSILSCVQSVVVGMPSVSQVSMMEEQQRQSTMVSLLAPRLTRLTNLLSGWRQEAAADPPKPLGLNVCACLCQEESLRPLVAVVHALTSLLGSMFSFL